MPLLLQPTHLQAFIFQTFSECELKDVHPGLVLYQIGNRNTSLGKVRNALKPWQGP